jgi:thioredoxin reductase
MVAMHKRWDAVVVGAGPAGVSCAVWLKRLGFEALLVEGSDRVGGLSARNPFPDIWTVTSPGLTGEQVAQKLHESVMTAEIELWLKAHVIGIEREGRGVVRGSDNGFVVQVQRAGEDPVTVSGKTVVLASGVRPRGLPGYEAHLADRYPGVFIGPGESVMNTPVQGLRVALLGGGDNAFENHGFLCERGAASVHVYARTVRAQQQFVQRVKSEDLKVGSVVVDPVARTVNGESYDLIWVFYGWQANAGYLGDLSVQHDARGFLVTQMSSAQTTEPGVYAIGEVAQRLHPCVPTAMADGVVAAKAIERLLGAA